MEFNPNTRILDKHSRNIFIIYFNVLLLTYLLEILKIIFFTDIVFTSTFLLTITNPITILTFFAVFAGLGLGQEKTNYMLSSSLVLGVFIGSAVWWLILSTVLNLFRNKITTSGLTWINRFSGILILSFAILAFYSLL